MPQPDHELTVYYPPASGSVIDLRDTATVARTWRELLDWKRNVYDEITQRLAAAVIEQADREGRWTLHYDGLDVEADSPDAVVRDWVEPERMRTNLINAGLPPERAYEAVQDVVSVKVSWVEVKKLLKVDAYAQIIEQHLVVAPKTRRIRVKGGGSG
jgi:hypothetical protein